MAWGLERISSRELRQWEIFDQHEPLGARRLDVHIARIMALLANIYRGKDQSPLGPEKFLIDWWDESRGRGNKVDELSLEEQVTFLELLTAAYGGKDLRNK